MLQNLKRLWCLIMKSYQKFSTKALSILVLFTTTYLCESGFSFLLHLKRQVSEPFALLEQFARGSEYLCAKVCADVFIEAAKSH